jgi:hypothetical protein
MSAHRQIGREGLQALSTKHRRGGLDEFTRSAGWREPRRTLQAGAVPRRKRPEISRQHIGQKFSVGIRTRRRAQEQHLIENLATGRALNLDPLLPVTHDIQKHLDGIALIKRLVAFGFPKGA